MSDESRELYAKLNECADKLQKAETTVTKIAEQLKKHDENPLAHSNLSWRKTADKDDERLSEFQLSLAEMSNQVVQCMSRMSNMEKEIIRLDSEIKILKNNEG